MKYAFVDYRISDEEFNNLSKLNCNIIKCEPSNKLYDAICGHPDILIHFINKNKVIIHKDTSKKFEEMLIKLNFEVIRSLNSISDKYPNDIILNAINTTSAFIHNLKYTDPVLLKEVTNKKTINVNQGYSKCSTVVINDNAFITSDKSIYSALKCNNYDVLLLEPGNISLPGLNYGFIGGTCGMLDSNTIVFYGSLEKHPQYLEIVNFLNKYDITPIYLSNKPLIDRGSIFFTDI